MYYIYASLSLRSYPSIPKNSAKLGKCKHEFQIQLYTKITYNELEISIPEKRGMME